MEGGIAAKKTKPAGSWDIRACGLFMIGDLGGVFIFGNMGLEYGNEKRVCTPFSVVLAFFVSVLIVLKFVGEYGYKLATKILKPQRKQIISENMTIENPENTPSVI